MQVKLKGFTYEVDTIKLDDDGIPYVRVQLTAPYHDVFIHYPIDMLTPEQEKQALANVAEHAGVNRMRDCPFLEGADCAFHVEEGLGQ